MHPLDDRSARVDSPRLPPDRRYTALVGVSRVLETGAGPAQLFPAVYAQIGGLLGGSAFLAALCSPDGSLDAVFGHGDAAGCLAFAEELLDRLRAGDTVIGGASGRAYLAVPLARDDRLIGCMVAERSGGEYVVEDGAFLEAVARITAAAIDGARLSRLARRRGEELDRLDVVARGLAASLELDEVVQRIAEYAFDVIDKPVVVWLVEKGTARAAARAGGALIRIGQERALSPDEAGRIGRSAKALREALDSDDQDEAIAALGLIAGDPDVAAPGDADRVSVPLVLGERLVGFVLVGPWVEDVPDRETIRLLLRMAPHAAAAVDNAHMHGELRELSLTDPLVPLPNRRHLNLFLEREFAAAQRGDPLCFALFDLDHFRTYNDTFGHQEGDGALMKFAEVLRSETRSMNLAARYGGEEFAAVLSGTGKAGGRIYADRVRRRVLEEMNGRLSVSVGVAEFRPEMAEPRDLVAAAEEALYRAKAEGRNRVRIADG